MVGDRYVVFYLQNVFDSNFTYMYSKTLLFGFSITAQIVTEMKRGVD